MNEKPSALLRAGLVGLAIWSGVGQAERSAINLEGGVDPFKWLLIGQTTGVTIPLASAAVANRRNLSRNVEVVQKRTLSNSKPTTGGEGPGRPLRKAL
jgi:hypothetical protein